MRKLMLHRNNAVEASEVTCIAGNPGPPYRSAQ